MERPRKPKGVSWDKGSKLRKVKYFSTDDCPSQIGQKSQGGHHHLQAKPSSILHSSTSDDESNDPDLPPGFENGPFLIQSMVKWKCPPQIVISPGWLVAAGEASEEKDTQKLRELGVLEAHCPRTSETPLTSPSFTMLNPAPNNLEMASSTLSSGMKRAASFIISPKEQSSVQFSSTIEKYLNAFGTARTTTTLPASQSNIGSSRSDAARPARDDGEFYKNLVRQRDETGRDSRSSDRESKPAAQDIRHHDPERHRSQIPACIYYNSLGGHCRNGAKCRFRHDVSTRREADNNVRGTSYEKILRL